MKEITRETERVPIWFHAKAGSFRMQFVYCIKDGYAWLTPSEGACHVALTEDEFAKIKTICPGVISLDAIDQLRNAGASE